MRTVRRSQPSSAAMSATGVPDCDIATIVARTTQSTGACRAMESLRSLASSSSSTHARAYTAVAIAGVLPTPERLLHHHFHHHTRLVAITRLRNYALDAHSVGRTASAIARLVRRLACDCRAGTLIGGLHDCVWLLHLEVRLARSPLCEVQVLVSRTIPKTNSR